MKEKFDLDKTLKELSEDNELSLEELFTYYYARLYDFSKSFLKLEQGIDDILQEVFIRIWHKRKNIKDPTTFNSYIFTITRNLLLNELRSRLNHKNLKDELQKLSTAQEYSSIEQHDFNELNNKVDKVIGELPGRQKEIFILSRSEGLSHKEIANKLQITTKTVEYHISLTIKSLKAKLSGP